MKTVRLNLAYYVYLFWVEYFISFLNIPFMAKTDKTAFHNIFLSAINMHINGLWMNVVGHSKSLVRSKNGRTEK